MDSRTPSPVSIYEGDSQSDEDAVSTSGSRAGTVSDSESEIDQSRNVAVNSSDSEDILGDASPADSGQRNVAGSDSDTDTEDHAAPDTNKKPKPPTNQCDYCGNRFATPAGLKVHIRRGHPNIAFDHYRCKLFDANNFRCEGGWCMKSEEEVLAHFLKYHKGEVRHRKSHVTHKFRFLNESISRAGGPSELSSAAGQNQSDEETDEIEDEEEDEQELPEQVGNQSGRGAALSIPDINGNGLDYSIAGFRGASSVLPTLEGEMSVLRSKTQDLATKLKESEDKRQAEQNRFTNVNGEKNKLIKKYLNDLQKMGAEKEAALQERQVAVAEKNKLAEKAQKLKDRLRKMEAEHAQQLQQISTHFDKYLRKRRSDRWKEKGQPGISCQR